VFLLAAQVAQQCLVTPEKSALTFSTESHVFEAALLKRIETPIPQLGNEGLALTGTGKDCLPIRALLLRLLRLILLLRFLGAVLASGVSNRLFCGGGLIHGSGLSD
jgi:hypothetical protein